MAAPRRKSPTELDEYRSKRNFQRTPEPSGAVSASQGRRFVIQKHAASHLHYDFRLEMGGTLKSWAVPKGPSLDPKVKRLAIHVEDHPLDYATFEGVIPQGEYGGGTVMIWDQGEWLPEGDVEAAYLKGHLRFNLRGKKLQGGWSLVRTTKNDGKEQWLLLKGRDEFASEQDVLNDLPNSVVSKRSMETIALERQRVWHSKTNATQTTLPETLLPQLATLVDKVPEGDDWLHEIKYDGYRLMCRLVADEVRLLTRNGNDWSARFPALCAAIKRLPLKQGWLDGEVVVVERNGKTSFQALQNILGNDSDKGIAYYLFDILYRDDDDLTKMPLLERKRVLASLLSETNQTLLRYADHVLGRGLLTLDNACELHLEGIIAKRCDGVYHPGRCHDWLKIKCLQRQEFVIGGYTKPAGVRQGFGALLLGAYTEPGKLRYVGRVGTGFTNKLLDDLQRRLKALTIKASPFIEKVPGRELQWVQPTLVAEVEFANWTGDGVLRHASFQGLREDKAAQEVLLETSTVREPVIKPVRRKKEKTNALARHDIHLSNSEKIFYPEVGLTKGDIGAYYEAIAQRILPELDGRLLTLMRCPHGHQGGCFFQKHPAAGVHASIERVEIKEHDGLATYLAVKSVSGLMSLVQLGILEIHVWGSKYRHLEYPDRLVFDLDPDENLSWQWVIDGAVELHQRLLELGLSSWVKSTGGKGLHVVVPIVPKYDWDIIKAFTKALAVECVSAAPHRYTANMSKAKRHGKIYIDYVRNSRGATAIANYSTRARTGAPVAVPLSWEELATLPRSDAYNVKNISQRLNTTMNHDPWEDFRQVKQGLTKAMLKRLGLDAR